MIIRYRGLSAALLIVSALGVAPAAFAADPVGHYSVQGVGPDKSTYSGTADVTKTGETYKVVWVISGETYVGTAIGNDKFLAVSYTAKDTSGLALYAEDGTGWVGPWAYSGATALGAEKWTR